MKRRRQPVLKGAGKGMAGGLAGGFAHTLLVAGVCAAVALAAGAGEARAQRSIQVVKRNAPGGGKAEARVALVIGNAAYKDAPLKNPANDAQDMAKVLEKSGFAVALLLDADRRKMERAIRKFGDDLKGSRAGLFFYAGHGMQVKGVNYLIPVGAKIEAEDDIPFEAVSANRVLSKMESARNPLNMVFLDACRNNPFARSFRSGTQGLAAVRNAPAGSVISYATDAGAVAADGKGRNGTYTANLLKQISVPGVELSQMMKRVRAGVQKETRNRQTPYELSSLTGDFYFFPPQPGQGGAVAAAPAAPRRDPELELWKTVENSTLRQDFYDYLREYPRGRFAGIARVKLRQLANARRDATASRGAKPQQAAVSAAPTGGPYTEPVSGIRFAWVPAGSFEMGCGAWNGRECDADETPLRTVRLKGFWMGATEVTRGQWKKVMGGRPPGAAGADNLPVSAVSWEQSQAFIGKLNKQGAERFRLPTEAEWEFACRAGGKPAKYAWGGEDPVERKGAPNGARFQGGGNGPAPVGSFAPNGLGLSDLSGNVWEWVEDVYDRRGYAKAGLDNPVFTRPGRYRAIRGGGWDSAPRSLRCSERYATTPSYGAPNLGFRIVRAR